MGKLKPIGSEKLQGYEKISRIMEIARYKESLPNSMNETTSNNYNIVLSDGNTYHIDKEKNGYVLKKTISEGKTDYLEPMKNRKFYSSYSQALKRLNLLIKEVNSKYGHDGHISLFNEDKKFVLRTPKPTEDDAPELDTQTEMPSTPPPPTGDSEMPTMPSGETEPTEPEPPIDDMGDETDDLGDEEDNTDGPTSDDEDDEEEGGGPVSFKTIQKLTGKLGQKLRKLNQGEEPISADDTKYVINSILSALDLSVLSDEDMEEIIGRLEDSEFESDDETDEPSDDTDGGMPEDEEEPSDDEELPDDGELPEMEMKEYETNEYIEGMTDGKYDLGFSNKPEYPKRKSYFGSLKNKMGDMMEDSELEGVSNIFDSVFSESKVDNIIKSYFVETEEEKKFIQEQKQNRFLNQKVKKVKTMKEVQKLSESYVQETKCSKFLDRYERAKFIGKTNKHNLVFEVNGKQYKITPEGAIL